MMTARVTYHAVLPFLRDEAGQLCAGPAIACATPVAAIARTLALAPGEAGAVAFSRTGDPQLGEWADAEILTRVGAVPDDLAAVSGV